MDFPNPPWRYESQNGIQNYIRENLVKLGYPKKYLNKFSNNLDLSDISKLRFYFLQTFLKQLKTYFDKLKKEKHKKFTAISLIFRTCAFLLKDLNSIKKFSGAIEMNGKIIVVNNNNSRLIINSIITEMYNFIVENRKYASKMDIGLFLVGNHYEDICPIKERLCYISSFESGNTLIAGLMAQMSYQDLLITEPFSETTDQKTLFNEALTNAAKYSLADGTELSRDKSREINSWDVEYYCNTSIYVLLSCYENEKKVEADFETKCFSKNIDFSSIEEEKEYYRNVYNHSLKYENPLHNTFANFDRKVYIAYHRITIIDAFKGCFERISFYIDNPSKNMDDFLFSYSVTIAQIGKFVKVESLTKEEESILKYKEYEEISDKERIKKWFHFLLTVKSINAFVECLMHSYKKCLVFFGGFKRIHKDTSEDIEEIYRQTLQSDITVDVLYREFLLSETLDEKKTILCLLYDAIKDSFELTVFWVEKLSHPSKSDELIKSRIGRMFYSYNQRTKKNFFKYLDDSYKSVAFNALSSRSRASGEKQDFLFKLAISSLQKADYFNRKNGVYSIAKIYESAKGVIPGNMKYALLYYKIGEKNEDAKSIFRLAILHFNAKGVHQDFEKGFKLLSKAVALGHTPAMCLQAYLHSKGFEGFFEKDVNLSINLYCLALKKGNRLSAFHLAMIYQNLTKENQSDVITNYICNLYLFAIFGKSTITLEDSMSEKVYCKKRARVMIYSFLLYLSDKKTTHDHLLNGDPLSKWFLVVKKKFTKTINEEKRKPNIF